MNRQDVRISTTQSGILGETVKGHACGSWAATPCIDKFCIDQYGDTWNVTHVATGLAATKHLDESDAVSAARLLNERLPVLSVSGAPSQLMNGTATYVGYEVDEIVSIIEAVIAEALAQ